MLENPAIIIATGVELVALATITGAVLGDLWILPAPASADPQRILIKLRLALWRVLGLCAIVLVVSAAAELLLRTASMSELPLRLAYTEMSTVLFKTHLQLEQQQLLLHLHLQLTTK